jgi:diguanylate cyclase (GGDEF)-like protein
MNQHPAVKAKTIGVMIGDVSYDFSMELMRGINDTATREGAQLFYMTGMQRHIAPEDLSHEQEIVSRYNSIYDYTQLVGADAYIISSGSLTGLESEEEYRLFFERFQDMPYVLLQKEIDDESLGKCSITIDNHAIFFKCMEHLIVHHGYKKIAYVSGPKQHPEARERERAYRDAMAHYGLPLSESMVVYGDLSGFVEEQVANLLSEHPGLEAIAFCNDEMAKTGYKVCEKRGLRVGIDIAITGFDDFVTGQTMTPPLTTVSQDAYRTGEAAVTQALALAEGKPAECIKLKTSLMIRSSCGCQGGDELYECEMNAKQLEEYVGTVIGNIRKKLDAVFAQPGQERKAAALEKLMGQIRALALADNGEPLDVRALDAWMVEIVSELQTSSGAVAERFYDCLVRLADEPVYPDLKRFYYLLLRVQGFLFKYAMRENVRLVERIRTQTWFVPEFIRDLVVIVDEDERVYFNVVNRLRSIGLKTLYICLLPEPQIRREGQQSFNADKLLLAAYLNGSSVKAYPRSRMPVIDRRNPFKTLQDLDSSAHMISFSIFSGEQQFGVCLCETDRDTNPLMHIIGLQLGILLNFLDLKRKERIVAQEIEHVQKKNEELNYLSEFDPLCNIYNRRGFIEQALRLNRRNIGKSAFLVFADLDQLKKINDNFGHAAGDDAIRTVSDTFKGVIRSGDLIARISGDEFVGMFIADNTGFRKNFETRLKQAGERYNDTSGKPYFVDISVGIADFTCRDELEISQIIDQADRYLYQAKQLKRSSVIR